ncbi:MAG: hypothetical protein V2I32_14345, partial [Desulforhopalus sp.]|nr:hypothetical protein [Desulforhopalus sp.]
TTQRLSIRRTAKLSATDPAKGRFDSPHRSPTLATEQSFRLIAGRDAAHHTAGGKKDIEQGMQNRLVWHLFFLVTDPPGEKGGEWLVFTDISQIPAPDYSGLLPNFSYRLLCILCNRSQTWHNALVFSGVLHSFQQRETGCPQTKAGWRPQAKGDAPLP